MKFTIVWVGGDTDEALQARSRLTRYAVGGQIRTVAEVRDAGAFFAQDRLLIVIDTAQCTGLEESVRRLRATGPHAVLVGWSADRLDPTLCVALRSGVDSVSWSSRRSWAAVLRDACGHAEARRRIDGEAHFRRFFEHTMLPAAVADAEGRLLAANQAMLRTVSREWTRLDRTPLLELFEPTSSGIEQLQAVVDGQAEHGEADVVLATSQGSGLPTAVRLFRTHNGASRSSDRLFLTVHQHHAAPPEVERRQAVFSHTGVGIAAAGIEAPWADINPVMQRLFDLPARISRHTLMEITHPEDRFIDTELFEELLAGRRESYQIVKRYVHPKSGATLWCLLIVSLERDSIGAPQTVFATVVDITEKKLAEEQLRESQAQLYHAQKLEAIGRLTGGVAHDLNNMLMAVEFNLHHLRRTEVPADARTSIGEIDAATSRARRLIQQLLAVSRKQHLQPARLSLNDVLRDMSRMLHALVGVGIEIRYVLDEHVPDVIVDHSQLEQVVLNLVVNARDAMPDGGVLTLRTTAVPTGLAADTDPTQHSPATLATLAVQDTGTGIAPEIQKRVFEPFFTTKEVGKGTGLGLSTVFGIVQQSGGELHMESEEGKGTTFYIGLPLAEPRCEPESAAEPATDVPPAAADRQRAAGETVLLVDDESLIRKIVQRLLEEEGYNVLSAGSPESAREVIDEFGGRLDAIVTDVVMPGGDGRSLAAEIERLYPDVKVVLMSGFVPDEPLGAQLAHRRFLQKPVDPATLSQTLRELLDLGIATTGRIDRRVSHSQ